MEIREITVTVRDVDEANRVLEIMKNIKDVQSVELLTPRSGRSRIRIDFAGDDEGVTALNRKLNDENVAVMGFQEEENDLEHMFMRVTKGLVT